MSTEVGVGAQYMHNSRDPRTGPPPEKERKEFGMRWDAKQSFLQSSLWHPPRHQLKQALAELEIPETKQESTKAWPQPEVRAQCHKQQDAALHHELLFNIRPN